MLSDDFKRLRKSFKSTLPFVRRRVYRHLERKYLDVVEALHDGLTVAQAAPLVVRKAPGALTGEVCLFVTHAPSATLKSHVVHHIGHLLRSGLQVILVVNTDLPLESIAIDAALQSGLSGVFVRENLGFDFAAWSHALSLCDRGGWTRLYLVNDSIVGPLDVPAFDAMMNRIRASDAQLTGLTENQHPVPHLQSYFLVFGQRILQSQAFERFMRGIFNFGDKAHVVDVYEVRLTRAMRRAGFRAAPVFADLPRRIGADGDLLAHWEALLNAGFPYMKTRVLQGLSDSARQHDLRTRGRVDDQI